MRSIASLHLKFEVQEHRTILRIHKQEPPLRVIRAFPILTEDGDRPVHNFNREDRSGRPDCAQPALIHLHNVSGGLLGGDQLHIQAHIGAGAQVQITSTGSTRVYRQRVGYPTTVQTTSMHVAAGGLLEYLPDTLIPYARSHFRQLTRIELEDEAGLFYWEVVAPGREAKGECFDYDLLQIELDILADDQPVAIERSRIEPSSLQASRTNERSDGLRSIVRLGGYRYFATFYICRVGVGNSVWLDLEERLDAEARNISKPGQILWGVSTLPAHGLSVRAVGTSCRVIQQALPRFWQLAKKTLYRQDAVMPRKIH